MSASEITNTVEGLDSNLLQQKYIDTILGTIYGNALGDAYGLATEFWNKEQILSRYPDKDVLIPFPDYVTNGHNRRWDKGDWTDDTDQMIVLMMMLTENKGKVNLCDAARGLKKWIKNGFSELGDFGGMGIGMTVMNVTMHSQFLDDPKNASRAIWNQMNRNAAANGAVMRTSILGCTSFDNPEKVAINSVLCSQLTHYDPRCIISCTTVTSIIAAIIRYYKENSTNTTPLSSEQIEQFIHDAELSSRVIIDQLVKEYDGELEQNEADTFFEEYKQYIYDKRELSQLELDHSTTIGYTYKCLGSGIWGLRSNYDFRKTINLLIREGGDADTNAAVAGALYGAKIGFSNLPSDMLNALPNKAWLDKLVVKYINDVILNPTSGSDDTDDNKPANSYVGPNRCVIS